MKSSLIVLFAIAVSASLQESSGLLDMNQLEFMRPFFKESFNFESGKPLLHPDPKEHLLFGIIPKNDFSDCVGMDCFDHPII